MAGLCEGGSEPSGSIKVNYLVSYNMYMSTAVEQVVACALVTQRSGQIP